MWDDQTDSTKKMGTQAIKIKKKEIKYTNSLCIMYDAGIDAGLNNLVQIVNYFHTSG